MNLVIKKSILIIDDDTGHRLMLRASLDGKEYEISEAESGEEAIEMVTDKFFDLVLLDLKMKEMDGIETLKFIKKISPSIPVLIMTAYASVDTAVQGLKLGAIDYMVKPMDMNQLLVSIEKILNSNQLKVDNTVLKEQFHYNFDFSTIIGESKKIKDVFEILAMAAPSDATILILGDSGTGKELIANVVYRNSFRKEKSFIKINCASLAENLLESELFGHEEGAFTGAVTKRLGRFEQADGGTLFLDEIGDMSLETQAKILRVLQEGEFERLGGEQSIKTDVRIIAATNKNLEEEIQQGKFRKDLFFRLSVVTVHIPPLNERKEDIPAIADYFLKKYTKKNNRLINGFTPAAIDLFMRYEWPGNVRELENIVESKHSGNPTESMVI
ncbi:MAG: sigma-54 dependent transcriptional regulator [Spirochaetales bacterium]|nr:sigma-54 dependent transcriptional regulator [Spirochaetales bacterium]